MTLNLWSIGLRFTMLYTTISTKQEESERSNISQIPRDNELMFKRVLCNLFRPRRWLHINVYFIP